MLIAGFAYDRSTSCKLTLLGSNTFVPAVDALTQPQVAFMHAQHVRVTDRDPVTNKKCNPRTVIHEYQEGCRMSDIQLTPRAVGHAG